MSQFASDEHEGLADAWGEATIGLDGEEGVAFADEFDWHGAGVKFQSAATEAEVSDDGFEGVHGGDIGFTDAGDLADARKGAGALDDFVACHFSVHTEDGTEFKLLDRVR